MPRFPLSYASPELVWDRLTTRNPGRSLITTRDRVRWLLAHRRRWDGVYAEMSSDTNRAQQLSRLAVHAKRAGLYSAGTCDRDVAHSLLKILALARACVRFGIDP